MSNRQHLESSKSGFREVYVQSLALEPARHTAAHECTPHTWTVHHFSPMCESAPLVDSFFFSPLATSVNQSVCIHLCQPGLFEPWLEVTNFTPVFLSRPLSRLVRLKAVCYSGNCDLWITKELWQPELFHCVPMSFPVSWPHFFLVCLRNTLQVPQSHHTRAHGRGLMDTHTRTWAFPKQDLSPAFCHLLTTVLGARPGGLQPFTSVIRTVLSGDYWAGANGFSHLPAVCGYRATQDIRNPGWTQKGK